MVMSALPPKADIGPESSTLFALDVRVANNAAVFVEFAADMLGEIIEANANRIKTELEELRRNLWFSCLPFPFALLPIAFALCPTWSTKHPTRP
jgi:hypothetical protein